MVQLLDIGQRIYASRKSARLSEEPQYPRRFRGKLIKTPSDMDTSEDSQRREDGAIGMAVLARMKNKKKNRKAGQSVEATHVVEGGEPTEPENSAQPFDGATGNVKEKTKNSVQPADGVEGNEKVNAQRKNLFHKGNKGKENEEDIANLPRSEQLKRLDAFRKKVCIPNIGRLKGDPPPQTQRITRSKAGQVQNISAKSNNQETEDNEGKKETKSIKKSAERVPEGDKKPSAKVTTNAAGRTSKTVNSAKSAAGGEGDTGESSNISKEPPLKRSKRNISTPSTDAGEKPKIKEEPQVAAEHDTKSKTVQSKKGGSKPQNKPKDVKRPIE